MNDDQLIVKTNLDPLQAICRFLIEGIVNKIEVVKSDTAYTMSPDLQTSKLMQLKSILSELKDVKNKLDIMHGQLLKTDALDYASLDAVYPDFKVKAQDLRAELIIIYNRNI
ncbi:hypothetical protein [Hymenobacter defluvii]|uniref:Uncharacterized protein n=1 Tax=Hymenobacter defluvii TaxID=2054411 RepID=A0ABS3THE6_9BACT|nr:hypothetical protein [Hymenobacter defluvii]MBO3272009.1 hypothetical protein [Hymenobacter defluvii]